MNRRNFLKNSLLTAATISTFAGLMITPKRVVAGWPKESFDITDLTQSIKSVYGHNNVESIMLFVENNPQPLSSGYNLSSKAKPVIGTRIKMGKTSTVMAAVKSNGKIDTSAKEVKITIGGCGG